MAESSLFTSESVSEGHPDKMADQISDAILDALLEQDKDSRVACETMIKTGMVIVAGEITTEAYVDIENIVRGVVNEIGYNNSESGFDSNWLSVFVAECNLAFRVRLQPRKDAIFAHFRMTFYQEMGISDWCGH